MSAKYSWYMLIIAAMCDVAVLYRSCLAALQARAGICCSHVLAGWIFNVTARGGTFGPRDGGSRLACWQRAARGLLLQPSEVKPWALEVQWDGCDVLGWHGSWAPAARPFFKNKCSAVSCKCSRWGSAGILLQQHRCWFAIWSDRWRPQALLLSALPPPASLKASSVFSGALLSTVSPAPLAKY